MRMLDFTYYVMTVKMHRVRLIARVLKDEAYAAVAAVVVHIPNVRKVQISKLLLKQDRIIVVDNKGPVCEVPE